MPQSYDVRHQGPAIICGGALCVFEDLENALKLHPQATILGVNNAAAMVPQIDHVWTQHNNLAQEYKLKAGRPIKVHARAGIMGNDVDYWWGSMVGMKGSSGVVAAIWAKAMGFDTVILAGIPLSVGDTSYHCQYPDSKANRVFAPTNNIEHWQRFLGIHKELGRMDGVTSMSGYTRQVLGAPC
jgi:hypothetical protein